MVISSSQTQIGPGNVISANQVGVDISGSTITGITVIGNLIGTDATGELDLGNAFEGVLIQGAGGVTIQGDASGSQVISGNTVGIEIKGPTARAASSWATSSARTRPARSRCPTPQQGVLIEECPITRSVVRPPPAETVISTNNWGIQIDGPSAIDNCDPRQRYRHRHHRPVCRWAMRSTACCSVAVRRTTRSAGPDPATANTIAFNQIDGVLVSSGIGDAILSNAIFSNGSIGISLSGTANDSISSPTLTIALPDAGLDSTEVQGSYVGAAKLDLLDPVLQQRRGRPVRPL